MSQRSHPHAPATAGRDVAGDGGAALTAHGVRVVEGGAVLLDGVDLTVPVGAHTAVLGPNGAGKTTLLRVLATYRYPTAGAVAILGERLGRTDVRSLRPRVGFVSVALDPLVAPVGVRRSVAGSVRGVTFPPAAILDDPDAVAAAEVSLARVGAGHLGDRRLDTLSQGERQRVRIARALASDPDVLLLDEPFAGLDLGGRERLLADLDRLLGEPAGPTVVLVTHHLEELPVGVERAVVLAEGRVVAAGPVAQVLTSALVSEVFGTEVEVTRDATGRWRATGVARDGVRPAPPVSPRAGRGR